MTRVVQKTLLQLLTIVVFALIITRPAETQTTELPALSYQAFDQLAQVYKSGGTAPNLVGQMNIALELFEEARVKRAEGETIAATTLENQARAIITQMSPQISAAQQEAARNSTLRLQAISVEAFLTVSVSTLGFYGSILIWRWYEREKLFEMKILAEETEH